MPHPAPSSMTVALLREELTQHGLPTTGLKAELVARVSAARAAAEAEGTAEASQVDESTAGGAGGDAAADSKVEKESKTKEDDAASAEAPPPAAAASATATAPKIAPAVAIKPEDLAGQVAAAIGVVEQYRMGSPLAPLQAAVTLLASALEEENAAPEPLVKLAATHLLMAPTHCHSLWEAAVMPVIARVLTNPNAAWIQRAFVAKKLPMTLQGQNAWGGADVVRSRTRAVVGGLVDQAAIGGGVTPQELRIVGDALFAVLSNASSGAAATAEVAKGLVASASSVQHLLPLLLSRNPPASFVCLVEDALCALPETLSARTAEGLKLLPAVYEGKGSASFAAMLRSIAADACRVAAAAEADDGAADDMAQLTNRIADLIRQGEVNAAAFRRAVNDKASVGSLFVLAASKCVDHGVSSKPHRLALLRAITLLAVFTSLPDADVVELLESPTTQHLLLTVGKSEVPIVGDAAEAGDASASTNAPLTAECMLDVDMTCLECQLLLAKKLFVGLPQSAIAGSPVVSALRATVTRVCKQLLPVVEDAQKQVTYAEKFLKTTRAAAAAAGAKNNGGRGKKRERNDGGDNSEAVTANDVDVSDEHKKSNNRGEGEATIEEMKVANGVLFVVHHLAKYLAVGSDFKVAPSWTR